MPPAIAGRLVRCGIVVDCGTESDYFVVSK